MAILATLRQDRAGEWKTLDDYLRELRHREMGALAALANALPAPSHEQRELAEYGEAGAVLLGGGRRVSQSCSRPHRSSTPARSRRDSLSESRSFPKATRRDGSACSSRRVRRTAAPRPPRSASASRRNGHPISPKRSRRW